MPYGKQEIAIDLPITDVWTFVKKMENWAPLVPGYISHEIVDEEQSTWTFKGDLGMIKKKIKMQVDITNWLEPTRVAFDLTGLNENFTGEGYFEAIALDGVPTKMTGYLNIEAQGPMSKLVNKMLESFVPQTASELTYAIGTHLQKSISK
jgi:carbon monoxide dehydrogenase subunit G